jgi:hypothetical protein
VEPKQNITTPAPLIRPISARPKVTSKRNLKLSVLAVVVVLAGITTGWLLSGGGKKGTSSDVQSNVSKEITSAGATDCKFDKTEGELKSGGVDGEGTHHLEKEGGPSQNVYLTSSVLDLESFVNKKVEICGETIAGKRAGWLMDVVSVKTI